MSHHFPDMDMHIKNLEEIRHDELECRAKAQRIQVNIVDVKPPL